MTIAAKIPRTEYHAFLNFANSNNWLLVSSAICGEKAVETWLTPSGRIVRVTRTEGELMAVMQ